MRLKPVRDADGHEWQIPQAYGYNGVAGDTEPQALTNTQYLAEYLYNEYMENTQHNKPVHELQGGEANAGLAGPRNTGSGVDGSTHEEATDTPDTRARKRARTITDKSTTVNDPALWQWQDFRG